MSPKTPYKLPDKPEDKGIGCFLIALLLTAGAMVLVHDTVSARPITGRVRAWLDEQRQPERWVVFPANSPVINWVNITVTDPSSGRAMEIQVGLRKDGGLEWRAPE